MAHVPPARSRLGKPEPAARPAFVAVLLLVVVLTFVMDPLLGLALVGMFGVAALSSAATCGGSWPGSG